ncbi:MAG: hypothetical protein KDE58_40655, partial [Caldilineaceae bacterium]|nr:hypothetical protein [Caldilineaceae bacterium]
MLKKLQKLKAAVNLGEGQAWFTGKFDGTLGLNRNQFTWGVTAVGAAAGALVIASAFAGKDAGWALAAQGVGTLAAAGAAMDAVRSFRNVIDLPTGPEGIPAFVTSMRNLEILRQQAVRSAKVALAVDIILAFTVFAISVAGTEPGSPEFKLASVTLIVNLFAALVLAVIAATVVGVVVLAVLGLLDAALSLACAIANAIQHDTKADDTTAESYACAGFIGNITRFLAALFYDYAVIADLSDKDRTETNFHGPVFIQGPSSKSGGIMQGNEIQIGADITSSLQLGEPNPGSVSKVSFKFTSDNLKRSALGYYIQENKTPHHDALTLGAQSGDWADVSDAKIRQTFNISTSYIYTAANVGLNQLPTSSDRLYFTESFKVPAWECWAVFACRELFVADSAHSDITALYQLDVFPADFDKSVTLVGDGSFSYRMAWDARFPVLFDADGDGLVSAAKSGNDPDDSLPDTDGDGLSDYWEMEHGL